MDERIKDGAKALLVDADSGVGKLEANLANPRVGATNRDLATGGVNLIEFFKMFQNT